MPIVAIALGLVLSIVFGGGIGRAHERLTEAPSAAAESDRDDALQGLTQRLLDRRLGADERRGVAQARQQRMADLITLHPAAVLKHALTSAERAALAPDVQALVEREESHDGTLQVLHADAREGGEYFYNLEKPSGERLSLHFADRAPAVLSGARVRVRGVQVQQALALGGTSDVTLLASPPLPDTFGAHRILVIRVEFQNARGATQQTLGQVQDVAFGAGIASATEFYREASYQQTWLTGDVVGPFVIALNNTGCDYTGISTLARAAASLTGVVVGQYRHLVYAFPGAACGWSGLASVGETPGEVWINGSVSLSVLSHELGHNFGLYHSHALECGAVAFGGSCSNVEYGDRFDAMGNSGAYHFNAVQKDLLGWLGYGASPPMTLVSSSGTYPIDPYETPGANPKALKVQTTAGDWLYVEYRRATGFDAAIASYPNVTSGVLVHYWTGDRQGVYLLDLTPATSSWLDPALGVGSTFADTAGGVSITPVWVNGTTAGVNIAMAGSCARAAPSVSVSPAQQAAAAGDALTYTVSVRNNDTNCAASTFALSVSAPPGWAVTLGGGTLSLAAGATGAVALHLTSPSSAAPATYAATIIAAGALSGSAPASYVVTPPSAGGGSGSFTDGFDRPDAPALDNGWVPAAGTLMVVSGEARTPATRGPHMSVRPDLGGAVQTVGARFASVDNNSGPQLGVVLRYRDASNYYRCYRSAGGASVVRIAKVVNGKETVLKSVALANPAKNALFMLSCDASGSTLTLSVDGVVKLSATDGAFASGSVGFSISSTVGTGAAQRADNFTASVQ